MKRNSHEEDIQSNQTNDSTPKIRKATFAENPVSSKSNMKKSTTSNPYTSNKKSNTTNNNSTPKQKKQKQNNNNTMTKTNTPKEKDKSKVTSYFVSGPARSNERVKNSRAAQIKNSYGRPARKGASSEITFNHKNRYDVNITLHSTTLETRLTELQQNMLSSQT